MQRLPSEQTRQRVLACVAGKDVVNIFNHERFGHFTSPEHIGAILRVAKSFRAFYISATKAVDSRIAPFLGDEKMEVWFLPVDRFDFKSEFLAAGDDVFISDDESSRHIQSASFADDIRLISDNLRHSAERCVA